MSKQQCYKTYHHAGESDMLKMMKCGKAVGLDNVPIEAFKALGHEGVVIMTNFFSLILHLGNCLTNGGKTHWFLSSSVKEMCKNVVIADPSS